MHRLPVHLVEADLPILHIAGLPPLPVGIGRLQPPVPNDHVQIIALVPMHSRTLPRRQLQIPDPHTLVLKQQSSPHLWGNNLFTHTHLLSHQIGSDILQIL